MMQVVHAPYAYLDVALVWRENPYQDWNELTGLGTGDLDCPQETSTDASSPLRCPSNAAAPGGGGG